MIWNLNLEELELIYKWEFKSTCLENTNITFTSLAETWKKKTRKFTLTNKEGLLLRQVKHKERQKC